ncbi:uncharacterized protein FA14DRAFT_19529 [Meira miltonrushii]|uniref:C2H2-type domain-containing protein n=1 Tax=Meira miltonrushii TaxID=1280837 RepID=A0A316VJN7_9BASI|nr:uncharacterized protein FA14DRAFT_19529 [Meira miltonrushii]PWN37819.1 hypothetical protein FA14DRAFT_19529 [Meira miltonrushii]
MQSNPMANQDRGQDFVLFDDTAGIPSGSTQSIPFGSAGNSNTDASAFTQYRNAGGLSNSAGIPGINESPFSSPASKPEDDFMTNPMAANNGAQPIPNTTPPSGTLAQGTPKSKRARGHGYSSSWTGGSIEQHLHQLQQAQAPNMAPNSSFGGFSAGGDWSGSDTSPQNPPSGSFGPPIHSLSLGDGSPDSALANAGQFASLFPSTTLAGDNRAIQPDQTAIQNALIAARTMAQQNVNLNAQQQETIARQQIQNDLKGVDSRALKGQLRDIKQGALPNVNPSQGNVLFPNVPLTPLAGDPSAPGEFSNAKTDAITEALSSGGFGNDQSLSNGIPTMTSAPYAAGGSDVAMSGFGAALPASIADSISSSYTHPSLPAQPTRQFSERTQNAVNRAMAQKPTRKRMTREGSGLTVSPQEAFLDYQNIDSVLQAASQTNSTLGGNAPNVFSSAPGISGTSMGMTMPGLVTDTQNPAFGSSESMGTPRNLTDVPLSSSSAFTLEGTPSLIDGGSSNGTDSRATSALPSPPQRLPLNREDTVRPSKAQMGSSSSQSSALNAPQQTPSDQQSSQGSLFSKSGGMLSPSESANSSTDDEDEKPYFSKGQSNAKRSSGNGATTSYAQNNTPGFQNGPRFSVVSSSSSESEDDLPNRRRYGNAMSNNGNRSMEGQSNQGGVGAGQYNARPRTMGGYGYMGSSEESGLFATPSSLPFQQQQQQQQQQNQMLPPNYNDWLAGAAQGMIGQMPPPLDTAAAQATAAQQRQQHSQQQSSSGDAPSETGSQSQDESSRQSPSIRSSAQAIYPFQNNDMNRNMMMGANNFHIPGTMPFAQPGMDVQGAGLATPKPRNRSRTRATEVNKAEQSRGSSKQESSEEEEEDDEDEEEDSEDWEGTEDDEDEVDESEGSPYGGTKTKTNSTSKKSTKTRKNNNGATVRRKKRNSHDGDSQAKNRHSGSHAGVTVCDYVSPMTGEECGTEFHRPYDLARHRETIHAREEATLLKQGKITKEQCVVLYKEVDPAKSLATVEWRCDGPNGCGALFSRKDALLRHRRIRNH